MGVVRAVVDRSKTSSRAPWVKIVKEQYVDHAFRDNEPIIHDEEDVWVNELYDSKETSTNVADRDE